MKTIMSYEEVKELSNKYIGIELFKKFEEKGDRVKNEITIILDSWLSFKVVFTEWNHISIKI